MSLTFLYGRAGSGKSSYCYKDIKEQYNDSGDRKLILIVPEQFSLQAEKNLIKELGIKGSINAEVLSFKRLAYRVFDEVGGRTGTRLNKSNKLMIISSVIADNKDKLPFFSKAVNKNGFVNSISELITEFKNYGLNINKIDELLKMDLRENTGKKLFELRIIYDAYESFLKNRFIDPDDDLAVLKDKIKDSAFRKDSIVWIDEFSGFTAEEYNVIESLLKHCIDVKITITTDILYDDSAMNFDDVFRTGKRTAEKITKSAKMNDIKIKSPVALKYAGAGETDLLHLERNYFRYPNEYYNESPENIKIGRMKNMFEEINYLASEIIRLNTEENVKLSDMTIVCRDLESYYAPLEGLFSFFNIPVFIDRKKDINSHPLIVFIKSFLSIYINDFRYKDVFLFLKSGLAGMNEGDIDNLENHVLEYGVRGSMWHSDKRWEVKDTENNDYIKNIRDTFLEILGESGEKFAACETAADFSGVLYNYLIDNGVDERLDILFQDSDDNVLSENINTWDLFMDIMDSIVDTFGDEKITLSEYLKYIEIGLSEIKLGILPDKSDRVFVGSLDRSINQEIKVLFIIGVNDGVFPLVPGEKSVLNDIDREEITGNGFELASGSRDSIYEEEFLVYKALTAPLKKLYITYPASDPEGKSLRPSGIVMRLKKIYPKLKEEVHVEVFPKRPDGQSIDSIQADCLRYPELLYGRILNTTVTRLESYAKCPFRYFAEYGLKLKERKVFTLEMPDIGNILHDSLEKISKEIWLENRDFNDVEDSELLDRIEEIYLKASDEKIGWLLESAYSYRDINRRVLGLLKKSVIHIVSQIKKGSFKSVMYEASFGDGMKIAPIVMEIDEDKSLRLHGRIDRVDKYKIDNVEYIRIIDYKSGTKSFELSDVYNGLELQLITYLDALENDCTVPGGVFYFKLDDPKIRNSAVMDDEKLKREIEKKYKLSGLVLENDDVICAMDNNITGNSNIIPVMKKKDGSLGANSKTAAPEEFQLIREHVRDKLREYGSGILEGKIQIKPVRDRESTGCIYCNYNSICRFDKSIRAHNYKEIRTYKDEEILEILRKGKKK